MPISKKEREKTIADLERIKSFSSFGPSAVARLTKIPERRVQYLMRRYPTFDIDHPKKAPLSRQTVEDFEEEVRIDIEERKRGVVYWGDSDEDTFI